MCPPPLVCPLCASAGGFTSPGALWLGLIGVANRLLSCPVCHELLLGLDKLTIHLVSHVPDLNLLASSIGNHININQKINDESMVAQTSGAKDHGSNFISRNLTSTRKKQSISRMNAKALALTQTSCHSSNFTDIPRSNNKDSINLEDNFFKHKILLNRQCPDQADGNVSPDTISSLSNKAIEEPETITVARKEEIASERVNFKSIHESSGDKAQMDISSVQLAKILSGKDTIETSTSSVLQSLPENKNTFFMEFKSNSDCPTQSFPVPSKKNISVAETVYRQAASVANESRNDWVNFDNPYLEMRGNAKLQNTASHSDNRSIKIRCGMCSMIFDDPKCLQLHCIMVHPSEDLLSSSFNQTTVKPIHNFPCHLCNRKFSSNSDLLVHLRYAHSAVPGNLPNDDLEGKLLAAESGDKIEKLISFKNHESQIHITVPDKLQSKTNNIKEDHRIAEKLQEETYPRKNEQRENITNVDDIQNSPNDGLRTTDNENSQDTSKEEYSNGSPSHCAVEEETKHPCKVCNSQFGSIAELIAHRPAHVEENGCICVVCGKSFKKEQHLQQHLRTHEGKQWECDVCCKFFTTKYFLKKHKRLHTGEMPYCCETCGKTFTFQQSYHKHLLYHSDEKPHACSECGKRFKELSTLHNHERIHTGEKPFTCESCGKAFRQRVSYLVHRRIHTGVMPYKCTACDKSFRYKVSQRTHKCSSQQTGTVVRQSSDLVERLLSHQKDKSSTNDCSDEQSEVTFKLGINDQSLKRNQEDEKLQNLTEYSPKRAVGERKINSYNLDSNSLHSDSVVINDSQNANSSFIDGISGSVTTNHSSQGKNHCNFDSALTCDIGEIQENAFNFKLATEMGDKEEKHSRSCPADSGNGADSTTVPELTTRGNSECGSNFVFTCESECKLHHIPVLNNKESERKGAMIQGNDNAVGEDFGSPMFSSTSHPLTHSEPDFFTLVMPPADPALEKLGKLSISSVHGSEKSNSGSNFPENHYHDISFAQKMDSTSKQVISSQAIQKDFDDHSASSKNSFIDIDHTELSRDQDGTANAADLSSFLQSCLEQWHPSNFAGSEKDKEGTSSQATLQPIVDKKISCPIDAEDNRLHTINEESLRRLLYGDIVP
ncbi:uncharacterized protein [Hetaerina americana]|uniref:uncharacterized protein n=1 Tax=Hetaerina americana TaxID=62018 RepID=UPI003A7F4084